MGERFLGSAIPRLPAGRVSEALLRKYRLRFFNEACRETGTHTLVQGHQADDVSETMLMRLARGSGLAGLLAPRPVRQFDDGILVVRPLLQLPKATLAKALYDIGLPWCEDTSNAADTHLRNRIRHSVIPQWETAQGAPVFAGVARTRRLLAEDNTALETWLDALWPNIARHITSPRAGKVFHFDWQALKTLPPAIHRRALWRVLNTLSLRPPDASLLDAIVATITIGKGGRWNIGGGWLQYDSAELLVFFAPEIPRPSTGTGILAGGGTLFWPDGAALTVRRIHLSPSLFDAIRSGLYSPAKTVFLTCRTQVPVLGVRGWRAGDAYRPLGAPGTCKLSDMFGGKKITVMERHRLPVVCDSEGILWAPGLPPAERSALTAHHRQALQLTWLECRIASQTFFNFSSP